VLAVYASNPEYLALTEGAGGEPGRYDLEMLQRDVAVARATPGRWLAVLFGKANGEPAGVLDWLDENPSDGQPWLGLLMIRRDLQRQGLATEAFAGLVDRLRDERIQALRAAVIERDAAGRALASHLGFELVEERTKRMAAEERILVLQRRVEMHV
jgi:RimJ/RimL family protein N-acetyltransferase